MITNQNDINTYKEYNKIYVPQSLNNTQWIYRFSGDNYIVIITNQNCYTNYNTTYCECIYYNYKENIESERYTCNRDSGNYQINYNKITSDINYSDRIIGYFIGHKSIILGIFILGILIALLMSKVRSMRI